MPAAGGILRQPQESEINEINEIKTYVVYILNHSSTAAGSRTHLFPHCG